MTNKLVPHQDEHGDWVCPHGVAMDVHCCGCHKGFIFDMNHECAAVHRKISVAEWRQYDALNDLVEALEKSQSIDNWPKRKRELAAKGLRMFLALPDE